MPFRQLLDLQAYIMYVCEYFSLPSLAPTVPVNHMPLFHVISKILDQLSIKV